MQDSRLREDTSDRSCLRLGGSDPTYYRHDMLGGSLYCANIVDTSGFKTRETHLTYLFLQRATQPQMILFSLYGESNIDSI
jgi:hypothetical protein